MSRGTQIVICHAVGQGGLIDKGAYADYQEDMYSKGLKDYTTLDHEQINKGIETKTVIIVDNAFYSSQLDKRSKVRVT